MNDTIRPGETWGQALRRRRLEDQRRRQADMEKQIKQLLAEIAAKAAKEAKAKP